MTIFSINSGSFGDVTVTGIVSASTLKGDGSQITSVSYDNIASKPTLISSSTQVTALLPAGTFSSSAQVNYSGISSIPANIVSSSGQVTAFLPVNTVSSSGQVTAFLPTGTVSQSSQVVVQNTTGIGAIATTGSNTFTAPQTISDTTNSTSYLDGAVHVAGGMSVRKDVRVSGSMTINGLLTAVSMSTQYVTSSQYIVGDNKIILNNDDVTRFGGMSIIDSGSASPTTASIYWDSLKHKFIYENLSGSNYNSAMFIAGPKNTGSLGDEIGLTSGYVPYATGDDHISDSVMYQTSGNVGIGTTGASEKLYVQGNVFATGKYSTSNADGYNIQLSGGNAYRMYANINDLVFRSVTAGLDVVTLAYGGNVGIGTTNPLSLLHVFNGNVLLSNAYYLASRNSTNTTSIALIGRNTNDQVVIDPDGYGVLMGAGGVLTLSSSGNFSIDSNTFYVDAVNNRVGIGTTIPGQPLDVVGYGRFSAGVVGIGGLSAYGDVSSATGFVLTTSGNLGLGVTPSAWSALKGLQIEDTAVLVGHASDEAAWVGSNAYFNGSTWKRITAGYSSMLEFGSGNTKILTAGSSTADSNITFTTAMFVSASGNVGIGITNPLSRLSVVTTTTPTDFSSAAIMIGGTGASSYDINAKHLLGFHYDPVTSAKPIVAIGYNVTDNAGNTKGVLVFATRNVTTDTAPTERWRIDTTGILQSSGSQTIQTSTGNLTLATAAGNGHIILSPHGTGNVGIGTATPASGLHIYGSGGATGELRLQASDGKTFAIGSTGTGYGSTNNLIFYDITATAERMRIDSSGNVGIGTIPAVKLDVGSFGTNPAYAAGRAVDGSIAFFGSSATLSGIRINSEGYGSATSAYLDLTNIQSKDLGYASGYRIIGGVGASAATSNAYLAFSKFQLNGNGTTTLTEYLRIDNSGNVGIGTTNPGAKLHILNTTGGTTNPYLIVEGSTANNTNYPVIELKGGTLVDNYPRLILTNGGIATIWSSGYHTSTYPERASISMDATNYGIAFNTSTTGAAVERMRVATSGKVGIGTTDPAFALHVDANGVGSTVYTATFRNMNTGSSVYNAVLWIQGSSGSATGMIGTGGSTTGNAAFQNTFVVGTQTNNALILASNDTERFRIAGNGKMSNGAYSVADYTLVIQNDSSQGYGHYVGLNHDGTSYTYFDGYSNSSSAYRIRIFSNGNIQNTNNSYGTLASERRFKQDIVDAPSQWDDIKNVRLRKFRFKSDVERDGDAALVQMGVIIDELEQVSPGLVEENKIFKTKEIEVEVTKTRPMLDANGNDTGQMEEYTTTETQTEQILIDTVKGWKTSILYMKAVKALQEAMARIETLEAEVAELKTK